MLAFLPLSEWRPSDEAGRVDELITAGGGFGAMILLAVLGPRFGVDSRDGFGGEGGYSSVDWAPKKPSLRTIARPARLIASMTIARAHTASIRPALKYLNITTESSSVPGPDSSTTELRAREKFTNRINAPASSAGFASGSTTLR